MENKKPQVSSSTSLTSQLFGPQESSSSNDVLASIFPPNKGTGRNSAYSENRGSWQEPSGNQPWNIKQDNTYKHGDTTYGSSGNKVQSSKYQQEVGEPSYLSSSLYYGGRDMYSSKPPSNQNSTSYPTYKKDGGEDEPSGASRGNWWQGSLYY